MNYAKVSNAFLAIDLSGEIMHVFRNIGARNFSTTSVSFESIEEFSFSRHVKVLVKFTEEKYPYFPQDINFRRTNDGRDLIRAAFKIKGSDSLINFRLDEIPMTGPSGENIQEVEEMIQNMRLWVAKVHAIFESKASKK